MSKTSHPSASNLDAKAEPKTGEITAWRRLPPSR